MKLKSDAHDLLSLLFQRDGVPPKMIMDGSKEQTLGRFKKKCQDADCRIKQTEPYSPWQNAAESAMRELKKAAGQKMVRDGAPNSFWADAIELEAYVCSNTAHDIFILQGEVPETVMSGETSDISQFCEFAFYDWIMIRDQPVAFPDDNPVSAASLVQRSTWALHSLLKSSRQMERSSTGRRIALSLMWSGRTRSMSVVESNSI